MKKVNRLTYTLISACFLLGVSTISLADTVGEITDIDLQKRLIEIDKVTLRLLDSTVVTSQKKRTGNRLSELRRGQVVAVSVENDSVLALEILPLANVPM